MSQPCPPSLTLADLVDAAQLVHDAVYDRQRLCEIERLHAADPAHVQPLVQDLLEEAADLTGSPVALLNVVLPGAQILSAHRGLSGWLLEARATPVEWSVCAHIVRDRASVVIGDWAADPRTAANPLYTVDGLRAYAGVPMRSRPGQVLGAFCVVDDHVRCFDAATLPLLERLSAVATDRLEAVADRP